LGMEPPRKPAKERERRRCYYLIPASEAGLRWKVSDGTRTRDRLEHNQELSCTQHARE
jgi:hypothetical protein